MNLEDYKNNDPRMWWFHRPVGKWIILIVVIIIVMGVIYDNWVKPLLNKIPKESLTNIITNHNE